MKNQASSGAPITKAALGAFASGDPRALHLALNLPPWTPSPLKVDGPNPPAWVGPGGSWAQDWRKAWHLRQALEDAA